MTTPLEQALEICQTEAELVAGKRSGVYVTLHEDWMGARRWSLQVSDGRTTSAVWFIEDAWAAGITSEEAILDAMVETTSMLALQFYRPTFRIGLKHPRRLAR